MTGDTDVQRMGGEKRSRTAILTNSPRNYPLKRVVSIYMENMLEVSPISLADRPPRFEESGYNHLRRFFFMTSDMDLELMMARYQQGDLDAANAVIQRLSPQLHRFFMMQFGSREHADDLLQETWLRIHKARHTYRPGEPVLPWFYAIARNIRVDHFRKSSRTTMHEQPLDETPEVKAPFAQEPSRIPDLEVLLAPLPQSQREVISMLKVQGMSLEEVARATSSSIGSVKQKAHRGYEKLREKLIEMGLGSREMGGLS